MPTEVEIQGMLEATIIREKQEGKRHTTNLFLHCKRRQNLNLPAQIQKEKKKLNVK
jgi:hypothetical protein